MKRSGALPSETTATPILNRLFAETITGLDLCLKLQLITTFAMFGIIWYVQLVQYPLFALVGKEGWTAYELQYTTRAGWVIAPLMLVELTTAVLLVIRKPKVRKLFTINLILLACIWLSTFAIQVPLHESLSTGWDSEDLSRLVDSNWIRTALWSIRIILLVWASNLVCRTTTGPQH